MTYRNFNNSNKTLDVNEMNNFKRNMSITNSKPFLDYFGWKKSSNIFNGSSNNIENSSQNLTINKSPKYPKKFTLSELNNYF